MKVLHTSDWHLGVSRDGISRREDHAQFLTWLTEQIEARQVDLLLVAGDVFDTVSPSADTQRQLYAFLAGLRHTPLRRAVLIAGNHDSAAQLDAPRALLSSLDIDLVGSYRPQQAAERNLCPVKGRGGDVETVVAAVPFVHEFRLGIRTTDADHQVVHQQLVERFTQVYGELAEQAVHTYGSIPLVAMGHLTCGPATRDDYPHEVHQVGTLGSLPSDIFDPRFRYVALGHLHQFRRVGQSAAYYSGSPVATTLREAQSPRHVLVFDSDQLAPEPTAIEVPSARDAFALEGELDTVLEQLRALEWTRPLRPVVYVQLQVRAYDPTAAAKIYRLLHDRFGEHAPHLAELRQVRPETSRGASRSAPAPRLRDLTPEHVFRRLCEQQHVEPTPTLLAAFRSLLGPAPETETESTAEVESPGRAAKVESA